MAKKKTKKKSTTSANPSRSLSLIVSDEKNPKVALKPGMKVEVVTVRLADEALKPAKVGARLCGGSGTCLALIDVE